MRFLIFLSALLLVSCGPDSTAESRQRSADKAPDQTVILISIDGFRADYMTTQEVPNLQGLAETGVWADDGMLPVFPTKTFPNHYSIATGLYPAHTGMVANTMYDEPRDAWFRISDRDAVEDPYWWGGEPIWVTAEVQGQTSATFFWVGSEAPVKGVQPTYWYRHEQSVPGNERVDQVLAWLDLPAEERPSLITLYFSDVDTAGHLFGPTSDRAAAAISEADAHIGRLLTGLSLRGIRDSVNLIVVSDHGMAEVQADSAVYLEDYIERDAGQLIDYSPVLAIRAEPARAQAIRASLAGAPGLDVLSAADLERLQYDGHHRIPSVIAQAQEGWTVYSTRAFHERSGSPSPGNHGYHPSLPSMRALFIAQGPAFRQGLRVDPFENIHLYHLMTELLGLTPAANDGDPSVTRPFVW
jgi:predicted AlkP superfamily pyrophosphatase or phosphodiesterase